MKSLLLIVFCLILVGCGAASDKQGGANSPGGKASGSASSPPAAQQAATNGAYNNIGTNINSERAANAALTHAATNAPNVSGAVSAPGGTAVHGGTGTGDFGFMFWIYVALDVGFLVWLVLAIRHRIRKPAYTPKTAH